VPQHVLLHEATLPPGVPGLAGVDTGLDNPLSTQDSRTADRARWPNTSEDPAQPPLVSCVGLGLENRYPSFGGSGVRISPPPPRFPGRRLRRPGATSACGLFGFGELIVVERVIEAVPIEQLGVTTLLDDAPAVHDDDGVRVSNR